MDVVNGKDMIFLEDDFIALLQSVQASFDEWIVHDATKELA